MAYGDLKVRNLIWNTGSGDNTVVLSTLATQSYVTTNFAPKANPTFTGTINGADLVLSGNLTVNGTQTIINTQTLDVEDKQIEIGKVSSPSDTTADLGGWKLKGATDKTFLWVNATDAWTSSEHIHLGDNKKLLLGTGGDLEIYHSGSHSNIKDAGAGQLNFWSNTFQFYNAAGNKTSLKIVEDAQVELYYDNSKKLETISWGVDCQGNTRTSGDFVCVDNGKFRAGNSSDLQIFHDGTNTWFKNNNGHLTIHNDGTNEIYIRAKSSEDGIKLIPDGAVELYHDNSKKLETISGGINVTGAISVNGSALSTSPTVELVADGAITAGKPCIVTAAGKAKQVANSASAANGLIWNSGSAASQGTAITPASGYYNTVAYDDDSDTVALVYKDGGSNIKLRLFSTSGNGLGIIADPVIVSGLSSTTIFCICKLSSRRFAVPYWNFAYGGNGRMEIVIVTVNSSANGISTGSSYSLDGTNNFSFYNEPHAVAIGDNRIAVIAKAHNTSCQVPNGKMALLVGDISSGNVYTARSNAQITSDTGDGQYRSIGYDSTNDVVGVAFTNNSNDVKFVGCKVAAGTGAAITQGTATDLTTAGNKPNIKWHSNSGSWISVVSHNNTSLRAQAHTINSATLAITSGTAVDNTTQGYPALYSADICISNQHLIYFIYTNSSNKCHALSATVSGTALTLNSSDITEQISGTSLQKTAAEFMAHNDKIVMFGVISGNYISGTGNTTNITSNLTTENYIGIAKAGASNNATATIDVSGSTNSSQSSLTPGQKYYVQQDGTLGLTEDTTKVFAGTAVAATKIIVNDQQPLPADVAVTEVLISTTAMNDQNNFTITGFDFVTYPRGYRFVANNFNIHNSSGNWDSGTSPRFRLGTSGGIMATNYGYQSIEQRSETQNIDQSSQNSQDEVRISSNALRWFVLDMTIYPADLSGSPANGSGTGDNGYPAQFSVKTKYLRPGGTNYNQLACMRLEGGMHLHGLSGSQIAQVDRIYFRAGGSNETFNGGTMRVYGLK